jgi:hypothetical protein
LPRDIGCNFGFSGCRWADNKECARHPNQIELTCLTSLQN